MKAVFIIIAFALCLSTGLASCSTDNGVPFEEPPVEQPGNAEQPDEDENENNENNNPAVNEKIRIKIGGASYVATLEDNDAAQGFRALLPLAVTMNEHAGNEKYYNLSKPLPTDAFRPGTIRTGDLMLWGDDCLVLFYETFSSSYSYTRIGKIDDPSGLAEAVGDGKVTVTFE